MKPIDILNELRAVRKQCAQAEAQVCELEAKTDALMQQLREQAPSGPFYVVTSFKRLDNGSLVPAVMDAWGELRELTKEELQAMEDKRDAVRALMSAEQMLAEEEAAKRAGTGDLFVVGPSSPRVQPTGGGGGGPLEPL